MGGQIIDTFQRTEIKYQIPKEKIGLFLALMDPYIQLDEYGLTTICNIYYDTENSDLVIRSLEKPDYKEKLRLRTYGVPDEKSMSFVEIKKKYDGVVYKRRAAIPLRQAEIFLEWGIRTFPRTQIVQELEYFRDFYHPVPRLFLAYDRRAYFGKKNPLLRMTIDHNLRYRETDLSLRSGDYGTLLSREGEYLLEIKVNGALPLEIVHILERLEMYPKSFSKYGAIYSSIQTDEAREKGEREYVYKYH